MDADQIRRGLWKRKKQAAWVLQGGNFEAWENCPNASRSKPDNTGVELHCFLGLNPMFSVFVNKKSLTHYRLFWPSIYWMNQKGSSYYWPIFYWFCGAEEWDTPNVTYSYLLLTNLNSGYRWYCTVAYKSWKTNWNQWGFGLQNRNLNDKDLQNEPQWITLIIMVIP